MRYCLACHRMSADGPLCTSCGRSFGGRLCNHKKGRHLNPPDANVCGQCGSTTLTDAANHIPFAWMGRLLLWGGVLLVVWMVGMPLLRWVGVTTGYSRYNDPRIWAIESIARVLMPLAIMFWLFYGIACFVPGEAGKMLRGAMTGSVKWAVQIMLRLLQFVVTGFCKLVSSWIQGGKTKT
jgi:hypothetical protein